MDNIKIIPQQGFDYINTTDPTVSVNPRLTPATWLNSSTGHIFICISNELDNNDWVDNG